MGLSFLFLKASLPELEPPSSLFLVLAPPAFQAPPSWGYLGPLFCRDHFFLSHTWGHPSGSQDPDLYIFFQVDLSFLITLFRPLPPAQASQRVLAIALLSTGSHLQPHPRWSLPRPLQAHHSL